MIGGLRKSSSTASVFRLQLMPPGLALMSTVRRLGSCRWVTPERFLHVYLAPTPVFGLSIPMLPVVLLVRGLPLEFLLLAWLIATDWILCVVKSRHPGVIERKPFVHACFQPDRCGGRPRRIPSFPFMRDQITMASSMRSLSRTASVGCQSGAGWFR